MGEKHAVEALMRMQLKRGSSGELTKVVSESSTRPIVGSTKFTGLRDGREVARPPRHRCGPSTGATFRETVETVGSSLMASTVACWELKVTVQLPCLTAAAYACLGTTRTQLALSVHADVDYL